MKNSKGAGVVMHVVYLGQGAHHMAGVEAQARPGS